MIKDAGGIDLQILGIGNNGHIGFNEPGSGIYSKTRLITLDNSTRIANSYEFTNISQVPRLAGTMGISTIFQSKKIILGWVWVRKYHVLGICSDLKKADICMVIGRQTKPG